MTELGALEKWLTGIIAPVAAVVTFCDGRVFLDAVPQNQPLPAILFQFIDSDDINTQMSQRNAVRVLVNVSARIEGGDRTPAHVAMGAVDDTIHGANGTGDGFEFNCYRMRPSSGEFVKDGVLTQLSGGVYEVWVRVDQS